MKVAQSCLTLCNPMDCSLSGSSVHGIFQATVLEWGAISFSRDLPDSGIEPRSAALQADAFTLYATREAPGSMPGLGRSTGEGIGYPLQYSWTSLVAQLVKNLPAMQETWV